MNTTRQRQLVVIGCIGIGLAGFAGYLMGHNSPPSNRVPSLTTLSPQQPQRSMQKVERTTDWQVVRPDLFTPPLSTSDPPLFPSGTLSASHETLPLASLLPAPSVVDPLADYIYNGTVNMGGTLSALIEHRASKQGWYVQAGDPWQNYRIVDVTEQTVTVLVEGKMHILPKSNVINLVPLSAHADSGPSLGENGLSQIAQADTGTASNSTETDEWVLVALERIEP